VKAVLHFSLLFTLVILAGCPSSPSPSPSLPDAPATPGAAPRGAKRNNGEAYNGPNLSGLSIPETSPRWLLSGDLETVVATCHQQFITTVIAKVLNGEMTVDARRSCWHVQTSKVDESRKDSFITHSEGHLQITDGTGQEIHATASMVGAFLKDSIRPNYSPLLITLRYGGPDKDKTHPLPDAKDEPFITIYVSKPLPHFEFELADFDSLEDPFTFYNGHFTASLGNVYLRETLDAFSSARYYGLDHRKHSIKVNSAELSQCLHYGLASQFEARMQADAR